MEWFENTRTIHNEVHIFILLLLSKVIRKNIPLGYVTQRDLRMCKLIDIENLYSITALH